MSHQNNCYIIIAVIIIAAILQSQDSLLSDSMMHSLYNDNTNLLILIAIVGLTTYVDFHIGLVLLFAVLLLSVKYRSVEGFDCGNTHSEKRENFIRGSVPVVQPTEELPVVDAEVDAEVEGFANLSADSQPVGNCERNYDFVGCKYAADGKSVNATLNGPPVAGCAMLDGSAHNETGAVFYPLHA
jgi:hypothetical protein